jgi:hypothetical protein
MRTLAAIPTGQFDIMTTIKISNRQASVVLIFIVSTLVIGFLTALSLLLAFANDEQGPSTLGLIGHYSFYVFRFPTHNLIWLEPELISSLFIPGLFVNVFLYSTLMTYIIVRFKKRKGQETS